MKNIRISLAGALTSIVILGPTSVGKTEIAFGLARKIGAEVINADKFYLFADLPEVTGQSDARRYPDVKAHLFGALQPDDTRWSESRYRREVSGCLRGLQGLGRSAIVEGCSNGYVRAAIDVLGSDEFAARFPPLLIGLRPKCRVNLTADCERRAAKMMSSGMAQAYGGYCRHEFGGSYVARKCFARAPLRAYLSGRIGATACRNRVAEQLEHHAARHHLQLSRIPGVIWIGHDRSNPEATIRTILALRLASTLYGPPSPHRNQR